MKAYKILTFIIISGVNLPCFSTVSKTFEGSDINEIKAGISKYILTKGGTVNHNGSYDNNTFQAAEVIRQNRTNYTLLYTFNLTETPNGTKLDLQANRVYSGTAAPLSLDEEQKLMENISSSITGRFLYGLGFDFEYYNSSNGRIKAPKGRETGIKLTAVKYDALKQGLQTGDIITEINGIPLKDIPLSEYAVILHAKSLSDSITLTYKRGDKTGRVTLSPRLNTTRVF
ncbi:MAG: PDZ domain-containing protein [Candidatus Gastranaerophilales bacterium]|nr:PDZ domain-containing protein [Candidatus Gastranaerophilales bacterium]